MIMRVLAAVLQLGGLAAVLVGAWLALPLWAALIACGVLLVVLGVAGELVLTRRSGAPQDGRSGVTGAGVA